MPLFNTPHQGMNALLRLHLHHAIKTGLAAAITYSISTLLGSSYSIWGVVTALIVMQGTTVTDSILASISRFTSMSVGALAGMLLLVITPSIPWVVGAELFVVCVAGSYLARYGGKFILGTTAVCIVLLVGQNVTGGSIIESFYFGLVLAVEVFIGVLAAVLVSAFIWPVRLGDTLRADLSVQFTRCAELVDVVVNSYIDEQTHVSDAQFEALQLETRHNRERMAKVKKLEAHIYHYEHKGLAIQVSAIERIIEGMRALIDALNEYDEESYDPLLGPEMRALADQIILALQHLGGDNAYEPAPQIVREMTQGVDTAETRLVLLRRQNSFKEQPLHRVLQLYSFYQVLRHLSEELLYALHEMQVLGQKPMKKKNVVHPAIKRY